MPPSDAAFCDLARIVLDGDAVSCAVRDACDGLHDHFHALLDLPAAPVEGSDWTRHTSLPSGLALGPDNAANCLRGARRTAEFVQGLNAAIRARLAQRRDRPVRVLYAGTGPFAPLGLLQCVDFGPDELQLTLIDLHPVSVEAVGRLVNLLGLGDHVERIERADAATWRMDEPQGYDIAIAEVMQRGLDNEPQVAVSRNLVRHLKPSGLLLPEWIEVGLWLMDPSSLAAGPEDRRLGAPFVLSAETAARIPEDADAVLAGVFEMPEPGRLMPMVRTVIQVFQGHALTDLDCGLTIPFPIAPELRPGRHYEIHYRLAPVPELTACEETAPVRCRMRA